MLITKIFKGEMAHIVRGCSTERCKYSVHGHSFMVEVCFSGNKLDNGFMVMDFSLVKKNIGQFIDAFDHCMCFWRGDKDQFKESMKRNSERWIQLPVSPSAEVLSVFFFYWIDKILKATKFNNGEGQIKVHSVKYYETTTGSATAYAEDLNLFPVQDYEEIEMSDTVIGDFSQEMEEFFSTSASERWEKHYFINPTV